MIIVRKSTRAVVAFCDGLSVGIISDSTTGRDKSPKPDAEVVIGCSRDSERHGDDP